MTQSAILVPRKRIAPTQIGTVPIQHQDWDMSLVAKHVPLEAEVAVKLDDQACQAGCSPQTLKMPQFQPPLATAAAAPDLRVDALPLPGHSHQN
eukprot:CAMPEP_0172766942 /NCGR_PEP_ID=MMETSP1074-20121228/182123_1 /TAXON_ID=2916 /ORGANISM="Ceratium fusus, Strain PA161109" /LENGTH=93 /DNA_ID=CAMNT_0013602129 /DNA_START=533 /DNA_END=814 /DNA_ORIENTATION=-